MEDPETWLWIWLGTAVLFSVGEIAVAGSFFLLPFAVGAVAATIAAALDLSLVVQWLAFVLVSGGSFLALRPIARRLDALDPADGIGARRLIGERGQVIQEIAPGGHDLGMARIGREEWRIESLDHTAVPVGAVVRVVEVRGTRAVVVPIEVPQVAGGPDHAADATEVAEPPGDIETPPTPPDDPSDTP
jgi:membrane protein implicated in regulation of membrane protease activity